MCRAALPAALALMLAACSSGESRHRLPCPKVDTLEYADQLTRFVPGPGRDITDTVFRAQIVNLGGECRVGEKSAKLDLEVDFAIHRGPASTDRKGSFAYFVAIPQFHPEPAGKRVLTVPFEFAEGSSVARSRDEVEVDIPLAKGKTGADYNVFVGFQLTPAELEYNQRRVRK